MAKKNSVSRRKARADHRAERGTTLIEKKAAKRERRESFAANKMEDPDALPGNVEVRVMTESGTWAKPDEATGFAEGTAPTLALKRKTWRRLANAAERLRKKGIKLQASSPSDSNRIAGEKSKREAIVEDRPAKRRRMEVEE